MLTVDVPENVSLDGGRDVLTAAESMTCAFTVACRQHRIAARARLPGHRPAGRSRFSRVSRPPLVASGPSR